ncbi:TetR family transcriptional regulator [Cellulomonas sp. 179-A 4D5 NHS]|uniref:TetR family transcriptional regulator n=1 Tax=Cellulomonas sp. 179-A 4D5 NHS TaxID=3142378 RepID=UPI00399F5748
MPQTTPRRGGRAREAAVNDSRIFDAARAVFTRDPRAPVAEVAAAAGVGKSALYRRYASKELLLRAVAEDVTRRFVTLIEEAHDALDEGVGAGTVLLQFLTDVVDADLHAVLTATAGLFTPTPSDVRLSRAGAARGEQLVARLHAGGALRADATWNDLNDWVAAIGEVTSFAPERIAPRRRRMVAALVGGLGSAALPLPAPAPAPVDYWPPGLPGFADRDDVPVD